jgi:hypothetical protein
VKGGSDGSLLFEAWEIRLELLLVGDGADILITFCSNAKDLSIYFSEIFLHSLSRPVLSNEIIITKLFYIFRRKYIYHRLEFLYLAQIT